MIKQQPDEHDPGTQGWAWSQRRWWFFVAFVRALSPARFSLFVALIGGALFLYVDQGTEILRSLAEQDQDTLRLNLGHIGWFFVALLIWSVQSWYWARVLLDFQFPGMPPLPSGRQGAIIRWCRGQAPRLLGVWPPLTIAFVCFFLAPRGYEDDASGDPKNVLRIFGAVAAAMAILLYAGFIWSRRKLNKFYRPSPSSSSSSSKVAAREADKLVMQPPEGFRPRYRHLAELRASGGAWWAVVIFAAFSLLLTCTFLLAPVASGLAIGSGAILCLAAATWVCFGSVAVWFSDRLRLPFIGLLVAWAVLCSLWNDNHLIRTMPAGGQPPETVSGVIPAPAMMPARPHREDTPQGAPVARAFVEWHDSLPPLAPLPPAANSPAKPAAAKPLRPVFIVATEGGGVRAAYWTALVLTWLEDLSRDNAKTWQATHPGRDAPPDFASYLFAISGVSGGSLGAAVFDALLAENAGYPLHDKAGYMLRQDFLSPTLAAMLFPDLLQRFLPIPIAAADRATALEKGWEHGWALAISGQKENRFAAPFRSLWSQPNAAAKDGYNRLPALFLNGTRVESGKRIITSNLRIEGGAGGEFSDANDAEQELADPGSPVDLPVSTAAHMSARFTYVSPAGRLPSGGHVVDGGYFENSAATTALEILYAVQGASYQHPEWPERLVPVVIEIRNGPVQEPAAKENATGNAAAAPPPRTATRRALLGEVLDPLDTLLNTRDARGTFSQATIEAEQREMKDPPPWPTLFKFGLYESKVPLPLGWMLSGGAAREMQRQLHADDLGNAETLRGITALLLPGD